MTAAHRTIDASALPAGANNHTAPIWWGNLLLLVIESMMFALLLGVYLYLRQNAHMWPPPRVRLPVLHDARPDLLFSTIGLALLLLSCIPMHLGDRAAIALDRKGIVKWTGIAIGIGVVVLALYAGIFKGLHFRWDENAYGSITWVLVGLHWLHILIAALEGGLSAVWIAREGVDMKHAVDVRCSAVYWFWATGVAVVLYVVVFLGPWLR